MSQADVDTLLRLWATTLPDGCAPFLNNRNMLMTIDSIKLRVLNGKASQQSILAVPPC